MLHREMPAPMTCLRDRARRRATTVLAAIALAACGGDPAPDPLLARTAGGFLRDDDGRALILRGVNLAGAQKESPYLDFQQQPDYARLRSDWGLNAIRFIEPWAAVEPTQGQYDETYLDAVEQRVAWAEAANLFVVVDFHQDVYGEGFSGGDGAPKWTCDAARYAAFKPRDPWFLDYLDPNVQACFDHLYTDGDTVARYGRALAHVAHRLKSHGNVLGVDPINEPNWGSYDFNTFEADRLEPFYGSLVAAVRAEAPGWLAFLEPSGSRNLGIPTSLVPFSFPGVVYAPHAYDAGAEQGNGFPATERTQFIHQFHALSDEAKALGAPLWIGEYGGDASKPGITDYMDAAYTGAGQVAASSLIWEYGENTGYGLLNPDGSEKPQLLGPVVRPYPERLAGDPIDWSFDPTSSTFTLHYHARASISAPTVLSVPARVYPTGYQVACGGCAFTQSTGALTITTPPSGDPATITLTPMP